MQTSAPRTVVFDGIGDQIQDDLLQACLICTDRQGPGCWQYLAHDRNVVGRSEAAGQVDGFLNYAEQIDRISGYLDVS